VSKLSSSKIPSALSASFGTNEKIVIILFMVMEKKDDRDV